MRFNIQGFVGTLAASSILHHSTSVARTVPTLDIKEWNSRALGGPLDGTESFFSPLPYDRRGIIPPHVKAGHSNSKPDLSSPHPGGDPIRPGGKPGVASLPKPGEQSSSNSDLDVNEILTWEEYHAAGLRARAKLDEAISGSAEDAPITSYKRHYEDRRSPKSMTLTSSDSFADPVVQLLGVDRKKMYTRRSIYSKQDNPSKMGVVTEDTFCPDEGTLIAESNWKKYDGNPKADQLPPSNIMMQLWLEEAGSKAEGLTWIVRRHIANLGTQKTMKDAHAKMLYPEIGKLGHFTPSKTDAKMDEAFTALSGTRNLRGMYPMLAHVRQRMNDLRPTDIYTFMDGSRYYLIMKLGR